MNFDDRKFFDNKFENIKEYNIKYIKGVGEKRAQLFNKLGIFTVDDLIKKSEDDMLKVRNLGRKSLDEVIKKLESMGLALASKED